MTWKSYDTAIESYSFHHRDFVRLQLRARYYFPFLFLPIFSRHSSSYCLLFSIPLLKVEQSSPQKMDPAAQQL
jgi:hypothetical protein